MSAQRHDWAKHRSRSEKNVSGVDYGTWDIYPCLRVGCNAEHGIRTDFELKRYRADATKQWSTKRPPCTGERTHE